MIRPWLDVWQYRELLRALIERELKARYRRSFFGFLWSLITPLYQIVGVTFVVKVLWRHPEPNFSVKYLCALLPWTLFQNGLLNSCASILRNRDIIKRVAFPRQVLPLAAVGGNLFHFLLSMVVLFIVFLIIPVRFSPMFLFLLVLLAILLVMVIGLGLLLSTLHTWYQDVEYALGNLLQVYFFLSPVMYPASWVPKEYQALYLLNPMALICEGFRSVLLQQRPPDPLYVGLAAAFAALCFVVGQTVFMHQQRRFPEII